MAVNQLGKLYQGLLQDLKGRQQERNRLQRLGLGWLQRKRLRHQDNGIYVHRIGDMSIHYSSGLELLHGLEEIFADEIYRADLPPNPYIIDCGAHMGMSVLYFLQQYNNVEIDAFEPDPSNFELLRKNVSAAKGSARVRVHREAVWKENGVVHFAAKGSMSGKVTTVGRTVEVPAKRLRDLLIRTVDLLKIDIEGAEYEVLKDIEDCLDQVRLLFVEYHGSFKQNHQLVEIMELVQRKGFTSYIREASNAYPHPFARPKNLHPNYDIQLNLFFFRPEE